MVARFVGRDDELRALAELCRRAHRERSPSAAMVSGDPGSGKSRLLRELVAQLAGVEILPLTGYEPEQSLPLGAARDTLRRLSSVAPTGPLISRLLFDPDAPRGDVASDQVRLFEAAHRAIGEMGAAAVLLIDDLHWTDAASRAFCHYLLRAASASRQPVALIAAARPTAAAMELVDAFERLLGPDRLLRIRLGRLSRDAGVQLAQELAHGLDVERAEEIWRRADGSPFWVEQLAARPDADTEPELRAIIGDRVGRLDEDAMHVLAILACASNPVPATPMASMLGWQAPGRATRAIDMLLDTGLASRSGLDVQIGHEIIRAGILAHLPADRRRAAHAALARWFAAAAPDDALSLLRAVDHCLAADLPATEVAQRAASARARRLLGRDGLARLDAVADACPPDSAPGCAELTEAVAELASELGDHSTALRRWTALAAIRRGRARARAAIHASRASLELGDAATARRHLRIARQTDALPPELGVEIEAQEAAVLRFLEHRPDAAQRHATRAVQQARAMAAAVGGVPALDDGQRQAYLNALLAGADTALMADEPELILALADELVALAAGVDPRIHVQGLAEAALALRLLGDNAAAEQRLRRAWDLARTEVLPQASLEVGAMLVIVLLSLGRVTDAAAVAEEAAALGQRLAEYRPARAFSLVAPHLVELSRGEWRSAVDGLRVAAEQEHDPHYRLHPRLERAVALARIDPARIREAAQREVTAILADAEAAGCRRCHSEALARCAEVLARIGASTVARQLLDDWAAIHRPAADRIMAWWGERGQATLAMAEEPASAVSILEKLIADAESQGLHLEALWARLDLATMLSGGDRARAGDQLRRAGADAERFGARTEQRLADQRLRALGVRTWRRRAEAREADALTALTARERAIADRVANGMTNPEIAAELFLSRKTVERHVSNVMAKLGLRNRTELAALIGPREPTPLPADE